MADIHPNSAIEEDRAHAGARNYVLGGGAGILMALGIPLYAEFHVAGSAAWNIFLILFLAGVAIAGIFLQRFFLNHAGEIGEARFDTRNKGDADG